jgi:ABC-type lipoprotein release transport system permease subunit
MTGHIWWRIAWRNVWRNRRRTAITVGALAIGFVASTIMIGLSGGIVAQMIENGTDLITGQIQVYQEGYKPERSLFTTLGGREGTDVDQVLERITALPGVRSAAPRVYAGGLLSSGEETVAGFLLGVDPALESRVSRILDGLETGALPEAGRRQVLIGAEMAEQLRVQQGSEIVLVAPAADGSMGNDVYTVSGTFRTGAGELDGAYAVLLLETLQELIVMDTDRVHEITVSIDEVWDAALVAEAVEGSVAALGVEARAEPWTEFRPDLAEYALLADSFNWVIVLIVFVMAIFGVANTMLMATFERRREFAVVRALGSPSTGIIRTVVFETFVLGVVSIALGLAVTVPLVIWWSAAPPDLGWIIGDFTMAGALVRANLRVEPSVEGPLLSGVGLLITVFLAGLYPAIRSARQRPADILAGAD